MSGAIEERADFSEIRYAQVWEDADILLDGLDVRPGDRCVSIASAGDNALALLTRDPAHVLAVDLSPAQLACVALRIAAYRALEHGELLELIGSRPSERRWELYHRCRERGGLSPEHAGVWDDRRACVEAGIGSAGRFERYFSTFRRRVLPLVHRRAMVRRLLEPKPQAEREEFYGSTWDNRAWRLLFRVFFSRFVMGRLGRDPEFFRYVEDAVAPRILARARHAMTVLEPAQNPYMQWILLGRHGTALPLALRPEHFGVIRDRLDRIELRRGSIDQVVASLPRRSVDRFNLSDIFEYVSPRRTGLILRRCCDAGRPGGRVMYWNMLVPRSRPGDLADRLAPLIDLATELQVRDKAFFYQRLVIEEIRG